MKKCPELLVIDLPICPVFGTPAAGFRTSVYPARPREKGRMIREKPNLSVAV